ncbi:hypothetical protein [Faecalicatena contorta]|uniref:hypothetical protein n=1 Tax=Faecalicatena contorta TaxID=39482 RepID=UPI0011B1F7C1|nr:hypothetical protein [Faecalicatena contorta]
MEKISRRAPLSTFDIVYVKTAEIVLFHRKEGHEVPVMLLQFSPISSQDNGIDTSGHMEYYNYIDVSVQNHEQLHIDSIKSGQFGHIFTLFCKRQ